MYSTLSGRQNANLPKILTAVLLLFLLVLVYQHYSNGNLQVRLEKDVQFCRERAKQVEKELDAIQKGLQLDLTREKSENERLKSELNQIKMSFESLHENVRSKDHELGECSGQLDTCQSEKALSESNCISQQNDLAAKLADCSGDKKMSDQNVSELKNERENYGNERQRLYDQLEGLQRKLSQRDLEVQNLMSKLGMNVNQGAIVENQQPIGFQQQMGGNGNLNNQFNQQQQANVNINADNANQGFNFVPQRQQNLNAQVAQNNYQHQFNRAGSRHRPFAKIAV